MQALEGIKSAEFRAYTIASWWLNTLAHVPGTNHQPKEKETVVKKIVQVQIFMQTA